MSMERLKQFTYDVLVPQGYSMSFQEPSVEELDVLIAVANKAKEELLATQNTNCDKQAKYQLIALLAELTDLVESGDIDEEEYDQCWDIKQRMWEYTSFDWYDPDTSYKEDVLSFYHAAKEHIEEL